MCVLQACTLQAGRTGAGQDQEGEPFMNAIINSSMLYAGLFIMFVLAALMLYNRSRGLRPQIASYGSQRMCPSCGLITSKSKSRCLECGKPFAGPV